MKLSELKELREIISDILCSEEDFSDSGMVFEFGHGYLKAQYESHCKALESYGELGERWLKKVVEKEYFSN